MVMGERTIIKSSIQCGLEFWAHETTTGMVKMIDYTSHINVQEINKGPISIYRLHSPITPH